MDYNLCSIMLPLVLAGAFVGVIISNILPEAILTIILVIVLFYLTYDSLSKAIGLWKKETIALEKKKLAYKPLDGGEEKKETEMSGVTPNGGVNTGLNSGSLDNSNTQLIEVSAGGGGG